MSSFSQRIQLGSDSASNDAFGRLRVSNPETLFDSKQLNDNQPLFWDEETGGGAAASSHSTANAATTMTVDANGEYIIRQSKQRMNYQPGKSQQILMTMVLGDPVASTEKYVGYFNSSVSSPWTANRDGLYLKQDGSTTYAVVAKNGTEDAVAQASWNLDKLDGSGPSGITVDWTKTQILMIDFEWLGVGRVRFSLNVNGVVVPFHEFNHANVATTVYMSSPNHSLRYEIRSTGGTASLVHICGSVTSEGGEQATGILRSGSTAGTHVDLASENTLYAIVGVRLKSTHLGTTVRLLNFGLQIQTASHKVEWSVLFNPTVANTFTYSGLTSSACEVATGGSTNTVTNGTVLEAGFAESAGAPGGGSGGAEGAVINALRLGANIDGTADEIVLCARPIGGSTDVDVEGSLFWRELL